DRYRGRSAVVRAGRHRGRPAGEPGPPVRLARAGRRRAGGRVNDQGAGGDGAVLRLARQARGFSQQQLAGMAGVSRQAVSAVESGLSDPSLRVALALAHALGLTVEELFGPGSPAPLVPARPLAPLGTAGGRLGLAPGGDSLVALPLSRATAARRGFLPAGGQAEEAAGPGPDAGGADPA